MVKAPPDNLGARQRALNVRVNDAVANNIPFDAVKAEPENLEVDKLYKIDLAAKYKNVDYTLEILKSGDSLYTSRALKKARWIFENEYSHIINPEYLQNNIFPFTSMKMKRKIIKTAAANVTTPDRAAQFFHYCMKEKMKSTAFTSLIYTTEDFKVDQLKNNKEPLFQKLQDKDIIYFRFFVGESISLLEPLLDFIYWNWRKSQIVVQFKNFFPKHEEKYLDLTEKYMKFGTIDLTISEIIMKKHKHRVLDKPKYYLNAINKDILLKNSTVDDVRVYAKVLFPDTVEGFWNQHQFRFIFDIIPPDQRFSFYNYSFAEKYPNEEFEMHPNFYKQKFYEFMTVDQREEWAYRHLKSEKQILGVGEDYIWYKFIHFNKAFEEIKRYISVTKNADKRNNMILVLIESAKTDIELESLFKYFNKRHMNELKTHRDNFLREVMSHHNIFEFDDNSWSAFYILLLATDLFGEDSRDRNDYKTAILLYNILHDKENSVELQKFALEEFRIDSISQFLQDITEENKRQKLHEYFFNLFMGEIIESKNIKMNHKVESSLKRYEENICQSLRMFNKDGEPKPTKNHCNPRRRRPSISPYDYSDRAFVRDLKKDMKIVVNKLPETQRRLEEGYINPLIKINSFLRKIKIYFHDDVAKSYFEMFLKIINKAYAAELPTKMRKDFPLNLMRPMVYALFQLADVDFKLDYMEQYAPEDIKTHKKKVDVPRRTIQKSICRYACLSRPPVPLSTMKMYMRGDYVKSCLNAFNTYLAHLPLPLCLQLVHLIIDSPVSIQKHAIRLAFQCFNAVSLREVILIIWNKTKNVSLRSIIYKGYFNKVVDIKEKDFYDVLRILTLDLSQDDESVIFDLTVSTQIKIPEEFLGDYIGAVWEAVNKFKEVEPNITRKKKVIIFALTHMPLVFELDFMKELIKEHVNMMIQENKLPLGYSKEDIAALYKEKWILTAQYVIFFPHLDHAAEKYVQLAQYIVKKCIDKWNDIVYDVHVYQKCCWDFFYDIKRMSIAEEYVDIEDLIPVFEGILSVVSSDLSHYDNYLLTWELQLLLITANVVKKNRQRYTAEVKNEVLRESVTEFGEAVGTLVLEYVGNNRFYMTFLLKVKEQIGGYFEALLRVIYAEIYDNDGYWKEHFHSMLTTLAAALVKFEIAETYLLAIHLSSTNSKECASDTFKKLVSKFEEFENAEVQITLFQKLQKYCNRMSVDKDPAATPTSCHIN